MPQFQIRTASAQQAIRLAGPIGLGAVCLWALGLRLGDLEAGSVLAVLRGVTPMQWLAALAATAVSFWAVGRYDAVIHRSLDTGIGTREAVRTGAAAIALSQVLGLGVVTGALARWRMLPGVSALQAARVSVTVALSFMAGWAVVAAAVDLVLPLDVLPGGLALLVLAGGLGVVALALLRPRLTVLGRSLSLPSLPAIGAIVALTALDTVAAGLALHSLLPAGAAPGIALLIPAYLFALGAALLTGTPGGVGPFELALLTLLPMVPEAELIGAILAFRLVYYALPACLAVLVLARPVRSQDRAARRGHVAPVPPAAIARAARAELGVARQNGAQGLVTQGAEAALVETPQTLTLLFAPARGPISALLPALGQSAAHRNRVACAYKLSARDACAARALGWHVVRVADDAVLDPGGFSTDGPAFRQLRRKLRQAEKTGITCRHAPIQPFAAMARLDAHWRAEHGAARGLTMGVFTTAYLREQRVYVAEQDGAVLAFVSFHAGPREWTLDLMRHGDDLPDGVMQTLILRAIEDAGAHGLNRFNLAAMPAAPRREAPLPARLRAEITARTGGAGLTRFKMAFGPRRAPLYAAAPSRAALMLALADLALSVHRPPEPAPARAGSIAFAPPT
ncbi:phosphatidylglycerol lysyltransferase domain-containing protein [Pseudooceanicola sp. LIPI14-2-Ac024]|uniref:phosphatidylglycerol lysyltransferase domain-containing protein n=1 Tax=Pseudooceanicola sp. LIPI14-2-Ac024 TaxID=3344875 RepID=UPI0035D10BC5